MKLWVVGKVLNPDMGHDIWEFCGVFDTTEKAEVICKSENYFVGPVDLNFVVPDASRDWPKAYYPFLEQEDYEIKRQGKIHPYLRNKEKSKSAMEKIADDIEEEMKDEEKEKAALKKADKVIAGAKKEMKDSRADWPKCPVCGIRPMAPWNKTGKCSYCQTYKKKKKDDI